MEEERILLGGWLLGYHLDDMPYFEPEDFQQPGIFRALKEGKNALDISREKHIPIVELAKMQSEYSDVFYRQIFERWQKDKIMRKIAHIGGDSDLAEIKGRIDHTLSAREYIKPATKWAEKFTREMERRKSEKTVRYGLPTLDSLTGGLHRKELTSLAARPSVGKSVLALQIALRVASDGNKVLFFPLEMSEEQTFSRIITMNGIASGSELKSGKLKLENMEFSRDMLHDLEQSGNLKIYEGVNRLERIQTVIEQEKPFMVIIDQLTQLKAANRFQSVRERFSYMTSTLKEIAMQKDISVLLLCQINRNAQNSAPTMADLKESGSIEEDSDNIILLHRLDPEKAKNPADWTVDKPIVVNLAKQRDGETGEFVAAFNQRRLNFYEKA